MKCPKCKNENGFTFAESLKRINVMGEEWEETDEDYEDYTREFEAETIYIKCNKCGYRAFGPEGRLEFGLEPFKGTEFDYSITNEEFRRKLEAFAEEEEDIKDALEKGWNPTFTEVWDRVTEVWAENMGGAYAVNEALLDAQYPNELSRFQILDVCDIMYTSLIENFIEDLIPTLSLEVLPQYLSSTEDRIRELAKKRYDELQGKE